MEEGVKKEGRMRRGRRGRGQNVNNRQERRKGKNDVTKDRCMPGLGSNTISLIQV